MALPDATSPRHRRRCGGRSRAAGPGKPPADGPLPAMLNEATKLAGWISDPAPEGPFGGAVVFAPRSRDAQRAAIKDSPRKHRRANRRRWAEDPRYRCALPRASGPRRGLAGMGQGSRARYSPSRAVTSAIGPEEAPALAPDGWWRAPGGFSEAGVDQRPRPTLPGFCSEAMTGAVVDHRGRLGVSCPGHSWPATGNVETVFTLSRTTVFRLRLRPGTVYRRDARRFTAATRRAGVRRLGFFSGAGGGGNQCGH